MSKKNEIYPYAPLGRVIFEIRFPGEPSIDCNWDKFYEKIRKVYPKIAVPNQNTPIEPYRFEREDGACGVMLKINKFGFYCNKYKGYELFKQEVATILSILGKLFKIKKIKRTGLRYINIIPFARVNNLVPINDFLNIDLVLPKTLPSGFKNINLLFTTPTKSGSITTHIESSVSQDQAIEGLILDFDYEKMNDLEFDLIIKYLDESHTHTKHFFEKIIATKYRKIMRGEVEVI